MQTTPTFDAIHTLVQRRNSLLDHRDGVRRNLRSDQLSDESRKALEIEFWHTVGIIDGIGQALEALREAGEHVASAEYIAMEQKREAFKRETAATQSMVADMERDGLL